MRSRRVLPTWNRDSPSFSKRDMLWHSPKPTGFSLSLLVVVPQQGLRNRRIQSLQLIAQTDRQRATLRYIQVSGDT